MSVAKDRARTAFLNLNEMTEDGLGTASLLVESTTVSNVFIVRYADSAGNWEPVVALVHPDGIVNLVLTDVEGNGETYVVPVQA